MHSKFLMEISIFSEQSTLSAYLTSLSFLIISHFNSVNSKQPRCLKDFLRIAFMLLVVVTHNTCRRAISDSLEL